MGFIWMFCRSTGSEYWTHWTVYKKLHGDLKVPYDFMVPSEAPWPEDAWGINLGKRVTIRNQEIYVDTPTDRSH